MAVIEWADKFDASPVERLEVTIAHQTEETRLITDHATRCALSRTPWTVADSTARGKTCGQEVTMWRWRRHEAPGPIDRPRIGSTGRVRLVVLPGRNAMADCPHERDCAVRAWHQNGEIRPAGYRALSDTLGNLGRRRSSRSPGQYHDRSRGCTSPSFRQKHGTVQVTARAVGYPESIEKYAGLRRCAAGHGR